MSASLLLILTEFPPSFGGMQTHAVELCRYLHGRGFRIQVATYRGTQGPVEGLQFPFAVHRCLSRVSYHANLRRLEALAVESSAELIYSSTVYFGDLAARTGLPVICRSAGNDVLRPWIAWPYQHGSSLLDQPLFEQHLYYRLRRWNWPQRWECLLGRQRHRAMRRSALSMSQIFANSQFTYDLLIAQSVSQEKISLLPGGVDAGSFSPGKVSREALRRRLNLCPSTYYLITACRLVPKKGLDTLLAAFASLYAPGQSYGLLIAGEGENLEPCRALVRQLGLSPAVTMLGYLPHSELKHYLHAADLFVLSSREVVHPRSGLRDVETMGRVLCEANACGLPVVATRSGGIPSVITHGVNGLLVDENAPELLAECILQLRQNPVLARELATRGLALARDRYDWSVLFAAHERTICSLLRKPDSVRPDAGKLNI